MRKYEYKTCSAESGLTEAELNAWGDEGWHLATVYPDLALRQVIFVFARKVTESQGDEIGIDPGDLISGDG